MSAQDLTPLLSRKRSYLISRLTEFLLGDSTAANGPGQAEKMATEIWAAATAFVAGTLDEQALAAVAYQLVDGGLSLGTARRALQTLNEAAGEKSQSAIPAALVSFQLHFLEQIARAGEGRSAAARTVRPAQRYERLQDILALTAELTQIVEEKELRARELEILHDQHMDSIWQAEQTLQATYTAEGLAIERAPERGQARPEKPSAETVPLVIGESRLGTLHVGDTGTLTVEEAIFVHGLVREMGSALNNAHLLQATRAYATQLRAAIEVSRAASTILEQERLMQTVVELIRERFNFYYVGLYLLDEAEAHLQAGTGTAGQALMAASHRYPVDERTIVGRALLREEAAVNQDIAAGPFKPPPQLPGTRSELALPLRSRGATIGALDVHASSPVAFNPNQIAALQTLADQIGVAVENASLFAQVQENYLLSDRLYRAGQAITEASRAEGVYQAIIDFVAASGLVDLSFIMRPDPESRNYMLGDQLWSRIGVEANRERDRVFRDALPSTEQLRQNEVLISANGQTDPVLDKRTRRLFVQNNVRGAAFIPIYAEGQWQGTLVLARVGATPPTEQELQPFLTLCDQAAVALSNLQLLQETGGLYRVSQALNRALTAEEALNTVVDEVAAYTGVLQVHILLYDETEAACRIVAEHAPSGRAGSLACPGPDAALQRRFLTERSGLLARADENGYPLVRHYLDHFELEGALLVPAAGPEQLFGILAVAVPGGQRQFTQAHLNFIQSTVDQLTTFLKNISLFNEALDRAQELVTLNQIGARLASILDLEQMARVALEEVDKRFRPAVFLLAAYAPATNSYTPLLHVVAGREVTGRAHTLAAGDPLYALLHAGEVVTGAEAVALAEITGTSGDAKPRSALWLPLQQEGRPIGLLAIQSGRANAFRENDVQFLRGVATQTGLALSNARLFAELEANVAELRTLFGVAQAAASSIDANERIQNMVLALHETLRGADVSILLVEEAGEVLTPIAFKGRQERLPVVDLESGADGGPVPAEFARTGLLWQAAAAGEPRLANDLHALPGDHAGGSVLAQLVVPLTLGQRTVGLINATSPEAGAFTRRDLRLLETLSASLAATIESARLFEEIQEANARLRQLDQAKTLFLANMSHELRTPLNSIIGFSRVILKGIDGPISERQEEDLTSIFRSGQHLLVLINDILDLAKIEAGKMALVFEPVDLEEIATSVLDTTRGLLKDKPVALVWEIAPDLPPIAADPVRLRQIMLNLLSNAAKYTGEGRIFCRIWQEDEAHVCISVADTGIGIHAKDYDKLFTAFEQVETSPTRAVEGTGLGLPITQSLVRMHQGETWLESEVGSGTTFYVRLPLEQRAEGAMVEDGETT